jgi:hypothetical protein
MSDQKNTTKDQTRSPVAANQPNDKRGMERKLEGQANTTDVHPGMPQRHEQGKPTGNTDDRGAKADPNPGPGVVSQGHRVDEDTPANGNEQDADRKQPNAEQDLPSSGRARDGDKDRLEPMDERRSGDKMPEEAKHGTH